jgi:Icc-related predicted phosphoesterase
MTKIGIITDIHKGYDGVRNDRVETKLDYVRSKFTRNDVDIIIVLGDIVANGENDKSWYWEVKHQLQQWGRWDMDVFALNGNHDAIAFPDDPQGVHQRERVIINDDVDLFLMDTAYGGPMENTGLLGEENIEYLKETMSENKYNIVATHYPLTYTKEYQYVPWFEKYPEGVFALDKFHYEKEELPTDLHLFGHLHPEENAMYTQDGSDNIIFEPFIDVTEPAINGATHILDIEEEEVETIYV